MTFIKRATSLLTGMILAATLAACGVTHVSDEVEGCPANYRHVEIFGEVVAVDGEPIDGRPYQLVVAAESLDPEYQGIYVVGTGVSGRNPIVRDMVTDADDAEVSGPVICVPVERAVSVMVRMAMKLSDAATAYEAVECALIDQGIVGTGPGVMGGNTREEGALGRVAYDKRQVELTDLPPLGDPNGWVIAQCNWIYVPDGHVGEVPQPFPTV